MKSSLNKRLLEAENDLLNLLIYGEVEVEAVKGISDESSMSDDEFIIFFMEHFKKAITRYVRKRLIKNRYSEGDVKAYIQERILDILQKRRAKGNPIREPKLYFRKLIDFYCIEYQRMHGYIYGMPKRPRSVEAEAEIAQYGFVYLYTDESSTLDNVNQLGYLDIDLDPNIDHNNAYTIKGVDPGIDNIAWDKLMLMVHTEQKSVLECIFKHNMSVPEAARYLEISISTAYSRKERGLQAVSGTLATFLDLDEKSWKVLNGVEDLEDKSIDITRLFFT